ncbi:unnamed protein product (macronuclear) [Paramecium tetraurelia]|uniref:Cilia-and flagella-associated protein 96 n=1 Tax=Paramecium tetraurelia TaxID=5888 RepID=A0E847_PARTE|nr:uncharacterized protein GSPATT00024192001 [Paramecium tetraurelia]CAK91464.1 unnamed protein product [Paramecium tetraurelia]|eukprot:XP_001458861.1 hypothetical protein (macronuclear) [Paramecium tetraurelia strain d4-2]
MSTQYRVPSNDNYIRDLENISQRERHGLFNQPPPLSLGDQYNDALKSQGKEKAILINKKLQKKHEPVLFSEPGYTTLNDPYKDQFKAKQIYDKERELAIKNPNSFKPNDHQKSVKHSEFEHMKEYNDKVFKTRNSAGNVVTQARNFLTNPAKKGLGRTTINNLFNRRKWIERRESSIKASNYLEQQDLSQPAMEIDPLLQKVSYQMEQDIQYVIYINNPLEKKPPIYKGNPFRPSNQTKKGFQGTFEVLQYMEEGAPNIKTKQNTFEKLSATQTYERPWRPNSNGTFARPCPSVSQQLRNRSAGSNQRS